VVQRREPVGSGYQTPTRTRGFSGPRRLRPGLIDHGWRELAVLSEHAVATEDLPLIHKDPFDRMLLAQAQVEGLILLTSDEIVAQYPGPVRKV
jgi:PIN domain nuclease of toxin-antitoxin system